MVTQNPHCILVYEVHQQTGLDSLSKEVLFGFDPIVWKTYYNLAFILKISIRQIVALPWMT